MRRRTLLDEALPFDLVRLFREAGCEVDGFPSAWRGLSDGAMLAAFEADGGGVLVTCDRNIRFQQRFDHRPVGLVVLPGQRLAHLSPLIGHIAPVLRRASIQNVIVIDRNGNAFHHDA